MPAKNRLKQYIAGSFYHLYNRGVAKQPIFLEDQDYGVFLSYIKEYLEPKDEFQLQQIIADPTKSAKEKDRALKQLRLNNFHDTISLLCYCLMPNHFHFLLHQKEAKEIDRFMNSLCTRYTMYFNKKYKRVGTLFQSVYKAVLVTSEEQLIYLTRYIHRNPIILTRVDRRSNRMLAAYPYSSYPDYLEIKHTNWIQTKDVLQTFSNITKYQLFVEDNGEEEKACFILKTVSLD